MDGSQEQNSGCPFAGIGLSEISHQKKKKKKQQKKDWGNQIPNTLIFNLTVLTSLFLIKALGFLRDICTHFVTCCSTVFKGHLSHMSIILS